MENLKFRAWHKKHEMYYDLLKIDWLDGFVLIDNEYDCSTADLDEVVIEQYTGLKDKNGKEIYVGDIVRLWKSTYPCLVYWDRTGFYWLMNGRKRDIDLTISKMSIIGNIHENGDFL